MSKVGTWAWAERTGGRLGRLDQAELLRQAIVAQLELMPTPWRRRTEADIRRLGLIEPPDSAIARAAEERALMLSEPALYAHCLRTWAFATLFGRRDGVDFDPELLYLACILHDLGLTTQHNGRDRTAHCFGVEGARAARDLLADHRVAAERRLRVAEAISLHLNITVPAGLGSEAFLLSKGAALDAVGRYRHELTRSEIGGVLVRWPRDGFVACLAHATVQQARDRPWSRAALLARLGFEARVRANPLGRR